MDNVFDKNVILSKTFPIFSQVGASKKQEVLLYQLLLLSQMFF